MTRESLRLELLKLTYTHGRDSAEAVGRAKELEKYLFEEEVRAEKKKKPGNASQAPG